MAKETIAFGKTLTNYDPTTRTLTIKASGRPVGQLFHLEGHNNKQRFVDNPVGGFDVAVKSAVALPNFSVVLPETIPWVAFTGWGESQTLKYNFDVAVNGVPVHIELRKKTAPINDQPAPAKVKAAPAMTLPAAIIVPAQPAIASHRPAQPVMAQPATAVIAPATPAKTTTRRRSVATKASHKPAATQVIAPVIDINELAKAIALALANSAKS